MSRCSRPCMLHALLQARAAPRGVRRQQDSCQRHRHRNICYCPRVAQDPSPAGLAMRHVRLTSLTSLLMPVACACYPLISPSRASRAQDAPPAAHYTPFDRRPPSPSPVHKTPPAAVCLPPTARQPPHIFATRRPPPAYLTRRLLLPAGCPLPTTRRPTAARRTAATRRLPTARRPIAAHRHGCYPPVSRAQDPPPPSAACPQPTARRPTAACRTYLPLPPPAYKTRRLHHPTTRRPTAARTARYPPPASRERAADTGRAHIWPIYVQSVAN
ncbi:hypothetical protein GGX14DRAFT_404820 [Mycena pura]|uniref:Uncharacterized protein n=1 Tax=Mycena pura TaxID=153505 RepID=A0AAD6XZR3_9AGAR|nr:hypothetical protein GGX14DRAFT_404820 [Mycena pura]